MHNNYIKRAASVLLSLAMLLWMAPAAGLGEEAAAASDKSGTGHFASAESSGPDYAEGQVVVLYEEAAVDTKAPSGAKERKAAKNAPVARSFGKASSADGSQALAEAKNTLGQQADILDESISGEYVIADTVILDAEDTEPQKIISVISSDSMSTDELIDQLSSNDRISIAEPNYIYHATGMPAWNDSYLDDAWQLTGENSINADAAWESEAFSGSTAGAADPIVIAVLDTGIDYSHPDISDRMWSKPKSKAFSKLKGTCGYDFAYADDDPMDENGHGTHCAGIIAGSVNNNEGVAGVAGDTSAVQLLGVRVLDEDGSGYLQDIVAGFRYIIRLKEAGADIRAINCSLGAPVTSDIFDTAIEQAGLAGILTVAAAGNETEDNDIVPSSPANSGSDYVISVAATDEDGSLASYSNYGKKTVDLAAPGSNILSSVSYENYAPYLYDKEQLAQTTEYYGEFGGSVIETAVNAQNEMVDTVTPVPGTDYNGDPVTGVDGFGSAVLLANRTSGSSGTGTLELTDDRGFVIGNNKTSLRWKISGAQAGDTYILYFPYDKTAADPYETYMNLTFRPHTDEADGGAGTLDVGDVVIGGIDKNHKADWHTLITEEEGYFQMDIDPTWNSIWQASGSTSVFFPYSSIKGLKNNMLPDEETPGDDPDGESGATDPDADTGIPEDASGYGLGMVYQAQSDGDVYIDISSIGISRPESEMDSEASFGKYDVYSGTSMAAPTVTGSVALLAIMAPEMSAEQLKSTLFSSIRDGYDGWCSTGGTVDFAAYTPADDDARPAVSGVRADFSKKTVTLMGRGFGASPRVKVNNNISGQTEELPGNDVKTSGDSIVISNAGAKTGSDDTVNHGIIGSDITFTVDNGGKTGQGSFYVIKGLAPYNDGYDFAKIQEDTFEFFSKDSSGKRPAAYSDEYEDGSDEGMEEDDPKMADGLKFLTGSNGLYMYDNTGTIYLTSAGSSSGKYTSATVGQTIEDGVRAYLDTMFAAEDASAAGNKDGSKQDNLWRPDNKYQLKTYDWYTLSLLGTPVYMGGSVYELVHADLGYREAYLLMGMPLDDEEGTWRVFYDSLADLGEKPDELDFSSISSTTLAGYKGRLYMLGSIVANEAEEEEDTTSFTENDIQMDIFSCTPVKEGCSWVKESARMPAPVASGYAVSQGGSLYYVLGSTGDNVDYKVYKFDGSKWAVAGELPKALYLGETGAQVIDLGFFSMTYGGYAGIPCAVSIDEKGILFGGMSFDGVGDTFRFNTASGKTEPLGYTLWEDFADRPTDGIAAGNKFWVQYNNDAEERILGKNIPVKTGYVRLERILSGDGTGIVTGGGYCPRGEKTDVTIVPDKGCYIYSVSSSKVTPPLNLDEITDNHLKTVRARQKSVKTTYPATANGSIDVVFGKISTSITAQKNMTMAVGTRDLGIYTDGTICDVSLKSSNSKYAKVNSDGSVTFRKAGVGKTVKITASALDDPSLRTTCTVKIVSRKAAKFKHGKYKVTFKTKVLRDQLLAKAYAPRKLKVKAASAGKSVKVTWKKGRKSKGLKGYIVLRRTGKGRFVQIAKVKAGKTSYTDKKVKKGKKYSYIVVGYKKSGKYLMVTKPAKAASIKVKKAK